MNEETRIKLIETCRLMMADLEKSMLKENLLRTASSTIIHQRIALCSLMPLFWVMTKSLKGKVAKGKNLLLLRQYQEEMLPQLNKMVEEEIKGIAANT